MGFVNLSHFDVIIMIIIIINIIVIIIIISFVFNILLLNSLNFMVVLQDHLKEKFSSILTPLWRDHCQWTK